VPDGTLILSLHVQPGAKRSAVAGLHGASLKIRLAAPALEGRANAALIEFLAEQFGVAKRDVKLLSGERSREKRVGITGSKTDPERLLGRTE